MLTEAWLRDQYVTRRRSATEIAVDCGWSSQYVRDRLREYGIPLRPQGTGKAQPLHERALVELMREGQSVAEIAAHTGYSTTGVYKLMRRWRIDPPGHRPAGRDDPAVSAEVARLYRDERCGLAEVGRRFGHGQGWAKARLREAGVEMRRGGAPRRADRTMIAKLLRQGLPVVVVAEKASVSPWLVREVQHTERIAAPPRRRRGPRLPPLDPGLLRMLYLDRRHTIAEIATELGCSAARVREAMVAAGIPRRLPGHRDDDRPVPITATQLRALYVRRGLTATEVAAELGCSRTRVLAALDRHHIARRREPRTVPRLPVDATTLARLYVDERLDDAAIAARYRVPTYRVRRRLRELGVYRPPSPPPHLPPPVPPPRDELERLYHAERLTLVEIARQHHTSSRVVRRWLMDAGILVRERTARRHRKGLDPALLRELYEAEEWSAEEIAAEYGTTIQLVLRALHDHGVAVRVGGRRPRDDRYRLLAALYGDPDVTALLRRHQIPRRPQTGPIADRFPTPARVTVELLRDAYLGIGLSARHIELLTGQPAEQILDALHLHDIPVRTAEAPLSPWLARQRQTLAPSAATRSS